jgi:hypothetical protein
MFGKSGGSLLRRHSSYSKLILSINICGTRHNTAALRRPVDSLHLIESRLAFEMLRYDVRHTWRKSQLDSMNANHKKLYEITNLKNPSENNYHHHFSFVFRNLF